MAWILNYNSFQIRSNSNSLENQTEGHMLAQKPSKAVSLKFSALPIGAPGPWVSWCPLPDFKLKATKAKTSQGSCCCSDSVETFEYAATRKGIILIAFQDVWPARSRLKQKHLLCSIFCLIRPFARVCGHNVLPLVLKARESAGSISRRKKLRPSTAAGAKREGWF